MEHVEAIPADPSGRVAGEQHPDSLLRQEEAAALIGVTARALEGWRYRGGGPKFVRISSRCVRYRRSDLMDWIENRIRASTSED